MQIFVSASAERAGAVTKLEPQKRAREISWARFISPYFALSKRFPFRSK